MQQTNASITSSQIAQQNEEELTRLMTSPVRAKMQFSNQKLAESQNSQKSQSTASNAGVQQKEAQPSGWKGK